jgi:hypothetical protein
MRLITLMLFFVAAAAFGDLIPPRQATDAEVLAGSDVRAFINPRQASINTNVTATATNAIANQNGKGTNTIINNLTSTNLAVYGTQIKLVDATNQFNQGSANSGVVIRVFGGNLYILTNQLADPDTYVLTGDLQFVHLSSLSSSILGSSGATANITANSTNLVVNSPNGVSGIKFVSTNGTYTLSVNTRSNLQINTPQGTKWEMLPDGTLTNVGTVYATAFVGDGSGLTGIGGGTTNLPAGLTTTNNVLYVTTPDYVSIRPNAEDMKTLSSRDISNTDVWWVTEKGDMQANNITANNIAATLNGSYVTGVVNQSYNVVDMNAATAIDGSTDPNGIAVVVTNNHVLNAMSGMSSYATNIDMTVNAEGYTNTTILTAYIRVNAVAGNFIFYNCGGAYGQTICQTPMATNAIVVGGETVMVPPNCGIQKSGTTSPTFGPIFFK